MQDQGLDSLDVIRRVGHHTSKQRTDCITAPRNPSRPLHMGSTAACLSRPGHAGRELGLLDGYQAVGQYAGDRSKEQYYKNSIMQRPSVWRASRGRALQDQSSDSLT